MNQLSSKIYDFHFHCPWLVECDEDLAEILELKHNSSQKIFSCWISSAVELQLWSVFWSWNILTQKATDSSTKKWYRFQKDSAYFLWCVITSNIVLSDWNRTQKSSRRTRVITLNQRLYSQYSHSHNITSHTPTHSSTLLSQ